MNDLAIPEKLRSYSENLHDRFNTELMLVARDMGSIRSWDDIERIYLQGQGLSPSTYRSYLAAAKGFFQFCDKQSPWILGQQPEGQAWLEQYFDHLKAKGNSEGTCYARMAGMKNYCKGIQRRYPATFEDPFQVMSENLHAKLFARPEKKAVARAMEKTEARRLLDWLSVQKSPTARRNYAIIAMLIYTGLRSAELLQLHWHDLEMTDSGKWYAMGVGKGRKAFRQNIGNVEAIEALRRYRQGKPDDYLFYSNPIVSTQTIEPLTYNALYQIVKGIGVKATKAGIITRAFNWSPHMMRRTHATILHEDGMSVAAIKHDMRHSSFNTTLDHYIPINEEASDYMGRSA